MADKRLSFADAVDLAEDIAEILPASRKEASEKAVDAIEVVIEKLDSSPLVRALKTANDALPELMADLVDTYFDPDRTLTVNQKVRIFEAVSDFALVDDRSRQVMGMMKEQLKEGASQIFKQLDLNTKTLRALPPGGVDDQLREMAGGEACPDAVSVETE